MKVSGLIAFSTAIALILAIAAGFIYAAHAAPADAGDIRSIATVSAAASHLSNEAFDLLTSLNAEASASPEERKPLLGPAANLAADAHTLSQAIERGDGSSARDALRSIGADKKAMDAVLSVHPDSAQTAKWQSLKKGIEKVLAATPAISAMRSPPGRSADAGTGYTGAPATASNSSGDSLKVKIESSRTAEDGQVQIKGYIEGRGLKSAGVYEGDRELKAFDVGIIPGMQRLNFELHLEQTDPGMQIRAGDSNGNVASADIADSNPSSAHSPPAVASFPNAAIADIPSRMPLSKRHIESHALKHRGDIAIELTNIMNAGEGQYRVRGKISGNNIRSAGIYVDNRMVAEIPVSGFEGYSSNYFDTPFTMTGALASVRAYRSGNQYVENLIPTHGGGGTAFGSTATATLPRISIAGIQPIGPSLWFVRGMISGNNLASAGLYQDGTLVQPIAVNTGSRTMNEVGFSARFNSSAGATSIRAFTTAGAMAEQPLMVSNMMSTGNPFFGSGRSGFGFTPFGSMGSGGSTGVGGMLRRILPW